MKSLCTKTVPQLKKILIQYLRKNGYKPLVSKNFIIANGNIPIALIAHMDTVFSKPPALDNFLYDPKKFILWAPGGAGFDDRTGIYIIIKMIERGYKPHIIFTDGEEQGGIGAQDLIIHFPKCPFNKCKYLIELDRANKHDMVFYDCDNKNFTKYIKSFNFQEAIGSFTDISFIMGQWEIAGVNLSVGYMDQHTGMERLNTKWCDITINKLEKMLKAASSADFYEYISLEPFFMCPDYNCIICNESVGKNGYLNVNQNYIICKNCFETYYKENKEEFISFNAL